ncbi:MAG: hypothetical protein R3A51_01710 [Nannocystaceae bacterium]
MDTLSTLILIAAVGPVVCLALGEWIHALQRARPDVAPVTRRA